MNPKKTISASPKNSLFLKCETKPFNTIVNPVIVIKAINLEKELASMKATKERLMQKRSPKLSIKMNKLLT